MFYVLYILNVFDAIPLLSLFCSILTHIPSPRTHKFLILIWPPINRSGNNNILIRRESNHALPNIPLKSRIPRQMLQPLKTDLQRRVCGFTIVCDAFTGEAGYGYIGVDIER